MLTEIKAEQRAKDREADQQDYHHEESHEKKSPAYKTLPGLGDAPEVDSSHSLVTKQSGKWWGGGNKKSAKGKHWWSFLKPDLDWYTPDVKSFMEGK